MSSAVVFDVDGVLVDSPHERAWAASLARLVAGEWREIASATRYRPAAFDTHTYQAFVAGKPRLDGARSILEHFGFPEAKDRATVYAEEKQRLLMELIERGAFAAFPDALRLVSALRDRDVPLAAASSSKNANAMMEKIALDAKPARAAGSAGANAQLQRSTRLIDCFAANVCGQDVEGKPAPDIFLAAAAALAVPPTDCVVIEDAPSGVAAAKNGGMKAIGIARLNDETMLASSGADLVVTSLDEVALDPLVAGTLASRRS
jgi:beta-phosphoglucomutase-like phosphatase (HAD superfamily)